MKWRNAEGREFPAEVFHGRDIAKVGHFALSAHAMRSLGYELVEDSLSTEEVREFREILDASRPKGQKLFPEHEDSVTAEQVGAPSANDESVRLRENFNDGTSRETPRCDAVKAQMTGLLREARHKAWAEGVQAKAENKWGIPMSNPYDPPTEAVSEEFEVVCGVDLGIGLAGATVGGEASLRDSRLIPGKTYVVREKR